MPNPTTDRQESRRFVTPLVADVLFYELVEISRVCPPGVDPPSYGTAHPDTVAFPDYKFSYSEVADDQGLWMRWYYCKDRALQETYSYRIDYPYGEDPSYPRITRWFIVPRSEGDVPLELGTPDPGTQANLVYQLIQPLPSSDPVLQPAPSTDGIYSPLSSTSRAVLVAQSEEPIPVESGIGSLYVKVTRTYDVIPGSDDGTPGSGAGQADNGYTVVRINGTADFFELTWKLVLPRSIADNYKQAPYTACPISGYENLQLIQETIQASEENNQVSNIIRVYRGNISGAPFPSASVVRYTGKFYPGSMPPDKFIVSKTAVKDNYGVDAPTGQNVEIPATPPLSTPEGKYDAMESVEIKPDPKAGATAGDKEITYFINVEVATLYGKQWDNNIRDDVPFSTFVMPSDEVDSLGEPEAGTQREITPLSTGWSMITIQAPRVTTIAALASEFVPADTPRTYITNINDNWPNVLYSMKVDLTPSGNSLYFDYEFKPRAYSGPCRAYIQVAWQKTQPLIGIHPLLIQEFFDPTPLTISWPEVLSLHIPACLHYNPDPDIPEGLEGSFIFQPSGTTYYKAWGPTNFHAWPDSYVKLCTAEPYLGGFWIKKITVLKPTA